METTLRSVISPVQLGKTDQVMGTIFRKQIMSYGQWVNPNWWWDDEIFMELTEELADQMMDNYKKQTYGKRISVPLNHTGDVTANAGEVIKLEKGVGGLWAYLDIRRPQTVEDIENGLVFDVSMGFDWDYVSQKDGKHYGATLIHVALVTDPYLNDMDDFARAGEEELSKRFDAYASNVGFGKEQKSVIMMSKGKVEEMRNRMKFSKIKNDKEYPVTVTYKEGDEEKTVTIEPGTEVEVPQDVETEVTKQVTDAVAPLSTDSEEDEKNKVENIPETKVTDDGQKQPVNEDPAKNTPETPAEGSELAKARAEIAEYKAKEAYNTLLSAGKIVPAQKEIFMSLATGASVSLTKDVKGMQLSKEEKENTSIVTLLSAILNAGTTQVVLNNEKGSTTTGEEEVKVELTAEQEAKVKKYGFNVETFKKQLAKGTVTLEELEGDK